MIAIRTEYLHHRYQVTNDKFVWDNVLNTVDEHGEIFHFDFSENITCSPKFEPQSAHFAKKQISLHCSVMHNVDSLKYIYHLSNELVHKSFFTIKVINDLLKMKDNNNNEIVRFESDNCSAQYKCKFVFALLQDLAINLSKMIIYYYGVKGHGKGLVDATSGFGIKTPLRNAIMTEDKYFNSAKEVYDYFMQTNNDANKMYFYLPEMKDDYNNRLELPIKGCTMQHMIIFEANGSIKVKENLCACKYCIVGDVLKCKKEKGKLIVNCHVESETSESDSDGYAEDGEDNDDDNDDHDDDEYSIPKDSLIEFVDIGNVIALYSHSKAHELFFLCKVLECCTAANDNAVDAYNHIVPKRLVYFKCMYLEKIDEKKMYVRYKLIPGEVFVLSEQVFCPLVNMQPNLTLHVSDYQFLCDMI